MKRLTGILSVWLAVWLLAATLLTSGGAWAKPTTPEEAQTVVQNWLGLDAAPLGAAMGRKIKEVQTFTHGGSPAYYVVYLNPAGLVILPADDLVEPIIAFLPGGVYDSSPTNPLGALVSRDVPGRVLKVREIEAQAQEAKAPLAPASPWAVSRGKWNRLANPAASPKAPESGTGSISDVRVAPFVQSRWSQTTVDGNACYNYCTPKYGDGNADNYSCGCTATAMAQLMRYYQYPPAPVIGTFTIFVDGHSQNAFIRGGNGAGGAYDWANMVLDPLHYSGLNSTQRAAIGALTYDAGVSVNMSYSPAGSSAWGYGYALVNTFKYSNGIFAYNGGDNFPDNNRNAMINANLHAQYPVIVAINGPDGGHSVVCDGYGYNTSTMYNHLNMGWSGSDDAWYNLPNVETSSYTYNSVYGLTYNVFVAGTGEIIAGRVTDSGGRPLSGVTVSASGGYAATTDANGIYALAKVPSNRTFTVSARKTGYRFTSKSVTTGTTIEYTTATGNQWGIDFAGAAGTRGLSPVYELILLN